MKAHFIVLFLLPSLGLGAQPDPRMFPGTPAEPGNHQIDVTGSGKPCCHESSVERGDGFTVPGRAEANLRLLQIPEASPAPNSTGG